MIKHEPQFDTDKICKIYSKKDGVPVTYVCTSAVNSYSYIKSIAEELRGLAVEKNLPIVSATQINRSGSTNTDPGLEDTSEEQ
jgi:hypothetical protein